MIPMFKDLQTVARRMAPGLVALCALSTPASAEQEPSATAAPRLHPLEAYCIDYALSGVQTGTMTECIRNYGLERLETRDVVIQGAGEPRRLTERLIHKGDLLITINQAEGTAILSDNTEYDSIMQTVEGGETPDIVALFAETLGGEATGETQRIAGETCSVWSAGQGAQEATWCMTPTGLVLEFAMPHFTKRATDVRVGQGGREADYRIPEGLTRIDERISASGTQAPRDDD